MRETLVRAATAADIEPVLALALLDEPDRDAGRARTALLQDLAAPDRRLVVAERDDAIVGYGRARLFEPAPDAPADTAPRGYHLTGVFVHSAARRGGIGAALTQARLDWIRPHASEAWFFTDPDNSASIALHRRFGFVEVTRRFSFAGTTHDGDMILFRLELR